MIENEKIEPIMRFLEQINSKLDNIKLPKKYYRNSDLKKIFGLSDNTIISYRDKNILPFTKIGEIYYYPISEIEVIINQNSNFNLFNGPFSK